MFHFFVRCEEHCFNFSRDILYSVFYLFSCTPCDAITFLTCIIQKRQYLSNEKRYSKKENAIVLYLERPFTYTAIIFMSYIFSVAKIEYQFMCPVCVVHCQSMNIHLPVLLLLLNFLMGINTIIDVIIWLALVGDITHALIG